MLWDYLSEVEILLAVLIGLNSFFHFATYGEIERIKKRAMEDSGEIYNVRIDTVKRLYKIEKKLNIEDE